MALEIASTPVKAELPEANARSNKNKLLPCWSFWKSRKPRRKILKIGDS